MVALVRRGDDTFVPRASTTLERGDRLIIVGEPGSLDEIRARFLEPPASERT